MYFNAPQRQNFTNENFALHVVMVVNVEFYKLYNGFWARNLMP